jgi:hypothetical protein
MQTGTFVAVGQTVALQGADLAALSVGDFVMVCRLPFTYLVLPRSS